MKGREAGLRDLVQVTNTPYKFECPDLRSGKKVYAQNLGRCTELHHSHSRIDISEGPDGWALCCCMALHVACI
jgi:hypothetical protein